MWLRTVAQPRIHQHFQHRRCRPAGHRARTLACWHSTTMAAPTTLRERDIVVLLILGGFCALVPLSHVSHVLHDGRPAAKAVMAAQARGGAAYARACSGLDSLLTSLATVDPAVPKSLMPDLAWQFRLGDSSPHPTTTTVLLPVLLRVLLLP